VSYSLLLLPRAKSALANLPSQQLSAAEIKIGALRENPRPAGCKKLKDRQGWRVRFGDYRIIYKIDDTQKVVTIIEVGHRREIYR
jgi:mRNA interferase RelE/StbE